MKNLSIIFSCVLLLPCLTQARQYAYQPTSPPIKNTDRARVVLDDSHLPKGFSYTFVDRVNYDPKYNTYVVGQHCYRGEPIRFDIPRENFTFFIENDPFITP